MADSIINDKQKLDLIDKISDKSLPRSYNEIVKELKLTEFEIELSKSVLKIESYYRSKLIRSVEYLYAFISLVKAYLLNKNGKNTTVGYFQIGILTSLRWTKSEINHVNYFNRLIQLMRLKDSIEIFMKGLKYFENEIFNSEDDFLEQFAKFYNGTPTQNTSRIKYSVALKELVNEKFNNTLRSNNTNIRSSSLFLDSSLVYERYDSIKKNIVNGENLCLSIILCDRQQQKVVYTNFFGSDNSLLPVLNKRRSVASTIKIPLYASYLEKYRNDSSKIFEDKKLNFQFKGKNITPRNVDNKFRGKVTFQYAFSYSINTIAVQMINELGIRNFVHYLRAHGIYQPLPNTPLLALGAIKLTGWELLTLLSPIVYDGYLVHLSRGNKYDDTPPQNGEKILSDFTVQRMRQLLNSAIENGTGKYLKKHKNLKLGGKTGTSEKNRDLWFVGTINDKYYGLVWLGMEDESEMISKDEKAVSASRYAVPIWSDILGGLFK